MLENLKERVTVVVCHTVLKTDTQERVQKAMDKEQNRKMSINNSEIKKELDAEKYANVSRNDLCPCGSGKKFKHCHGRIMG